MTVKDLKRKLDLIPEDQNDFQVLLDAGDVNLLYLQSVYIGGAWNIVLSADEDDFDIEDNLENKNL